uniref:Rhodanese domain-containing protein n=1 Tax=Leptobrachium leishanense TaxID=445787 RepID=A0A8C5R834_9ANUR
MIGNPSWNSVLLLFWPMNSLTDTAALIFCVPDVQSLRESLHGMSCQYDWIPVAFTANYSCGCSVIPEITYGELNKQIADGPVQIFDVRTPEEVEKGKIPDAVNIPVTAFQEAFKMDPETFAKTFKVNKPKLDDNFVVHCYMGKRGAQAADIATGMGYAHVRNLLGGYKEWAEKEGIPSEGVGHF